MKRIPATGSGRFVRQDSAFRDWVTADEVPGVSETVDIEQIKRHYFGTHPSINPSGLIPAGPVVDLAPHGREALAD